jgi:hypothetical protein
MAREKSSGEGVSESESCQNETTKEEMQNQCELRFYTFNQSRSGSKLAVHFNQSKSASKLAVHFNQSRSGSKLAVHFNQCRSGSKLTVHFNQSRSGSKLAVHFKARERIRM